MSAAAIYDSIKTLASAQEWRPFDEPETRGRPRPRPPVSGSDRAPLEPMDGAAAPWTSRGYGAQPYAPPGEGAATARGAAPSSTAPFSPDDRWPPGQAPIRGVVREALDGPQGELAPAGPGGASTRDARAAPAATGTGLGSDPWAGLDLAALEQQIASLPFPIRSPALADLVVRLLAAVPAQATGGPDDSVRRIVLAAEALHRAGHPAQSRDVLSRLADGADGANRDPLVAALAARAAIVVGDRDAGCAGARGIAGGKIALPPQIRGDLIVLGGYCAAAGGNKGAAGLAAELLREEGQDRGLTLQVLDALAAGTQPRPTLPQRITALDYRLIELVGGTDEPLLVDRAEPALLAVLSELDATAYPHAAAAAEAASRLGLVSPARLAEAWRKARADGAANTDPLTARTGDPTLRRAALFRAAEAERTPMRKTRLVRALADDARRAGLGLPALEALAGPVAQMSAQPEIGWFAETAIEAHLAAGNLDAARSWVSFGRTVDRTGGEGTEHWLALIDIADASPGLDRARGLASVEALATRGRLAPDLLHRIVTVLDALDIQIPIPLWDAASRAPQPTGGHLPATGVLAELLDASKKRQTGRTALLALRTLGPGGAEGANMIALGDAIRGLRRAGLPSEARRVGLEALVAGWPRGGAS